MVKKLAIRERKNYLEHFSKELKVELQEHLSLPLQLVITIALIPV